MNVPDEIERLRREAADRIERAARRDRSLSPEEDAEILALLTKAQELEHRGKQNQKTRHRTPGRGKSA